MRPPSRGSHVALRAPRRNATLPARAASSSIATAYFEETDSIARYTRARFVNTREPAKAAIRNSLRPSSPGRRAHPAHSRPYPLGRPPLPGGCAPSRPREGRAAPLDSRTDPARTRSPRAGSRSSPTNARAPRQTLAHLEAQHYRAQARRPAPHPSASSGTARVRMLRDARSCRLTAPRTEALRAARLARRPPGRACRGRAARATARASRRRAADRRRPRRPPTNAASSRESVASADA